MRVQSGEGTRAPLVIAVASRAGPPSPPKKGRLPNHADLAHEDQIERRIERRNYLRRNENPTARQREDCRLLLLESGKRQGKSPAGFGAVPKRNGISSAGSNPNPDESPAI